MPPRPEPGDLSGEATAADAAALRGVPIAPIIDDRVERILADPQRYFDEARRRIRAEVVEEVRRERS